MCYSQWVTWFIWDFFFAPTKSQQNAESSKDPGLNNSHSMLPLLQYTCMFDLWTHRMTTYIPKMKNCYCYVQTVKLCILFLYIKNHEREKKPTNFVLVISVYVSSRLVHIIKGKIHGCKQRQQGSIRWRDGLKGYSHSYTSEKEPHARSLFSLSKSQIVCEKISSISLLSCCVIAGCTPWI